MTLARHAERAGALPIPRPTGTPRPRHSSVTVRSHPVPSAGLVVSLSLDFHLRPNVGGERGLSRVGLHDQTFAGLAGLNLTKLESRPTKQSLGDYCFVIDLEGHIADEVVGDCLKELHLSLAGLKFLGSYPAAGAHGPRVREAVSIRRREAESWLSSVRHQIGGVG